MDLSWHQLASVGPQLHQLDLSWHQLDLSWHHLHQMDLRLHQLGLMLLTSFGDSFGQFALIYCLTRTNLT